MTKQIFEEITKHIGGLIEDTVFKGHTFVVGGAVRDLVMGRKINDIDIVVSIENGGIRFAKWMEKSGYTLGSVVTYPTYGTAMFRLKEYPETEIECVQTRKEQYKDKNSRNPETSYGTLYEDAMRRDLTINSLYYDLCSSEILDPTGNGVNDIDEHRIRVTSDPDIVYTDDPLRILRCIRFYTRFYSECDDWHIDDKTFEGMSKHHERLSIITKERIQDELNKMLMCQQPVKAMELLRETDTLQYVIPELCDTIGLEQNKYHIGDVWTHTMSVLDKASRRPFYGAASLELRMAALLHDIGKIKTRTVDENGNTHFIKHELASAELCETILRRLKYSNSFIEYVKFLVKNHMRTKQWGDCCESMKDKKLRKLQYDCGGLGMYFNLLSLIDADNKSHAEGFGLPNQIYAINRRTREMFDDGTDMFDYELPIDGKDVMEIKHLEPCKKVRECLDYALKLAFNDPKMTREQMLKYVRGYKFKKEIES